jgi:hypothetical protein
MQTSENIQTSENTQTIVFSKIKNCQNLGEIYNLINSYYPNWIVDMFDEYSTDYPHLSSNWSHMCSTVNTTKKSILLVSHISFVENMVENMIENVNESIEILKMISELLTKMGFVIRIKGDFIHCKKCNKAIPKKEIYDIIIKTKNDKKISNIYIPNEWNDICTNC